MFDWAIVYYIFQSRINKWIHGYVEQKYETLIICGHALSAEKLNITSTNKKKPLFWLRLKYLTTETII